MQSHSNRNALLAFSNIEIERQSFSSDRCSADTNRCNKEFPAQCDQKSFRLQLKIMKSQI
jgi:hypothetical protein